MLHSLGKSQAVSEIVVAISADVDLDLDRWTKVFLFPIWVSVRRLLVFCTSSCLILEFDVIPCFKQSPIMMSSPSENSLLSMSDDKWQLNRVLHCFLVRLLPGMTKSQAGGYIEINSVKILNEKRQDILI